MTTVSRQWWGTARSRSHWRSRPAWPSPTVPSTPSRRSPTEPGGSLRSPPPESGWRRSGDLGWWPGPVAPLLGQAFDDHCHALAAAYAHRLETEGLPGVLQAVEQGGHDAGTGLAERMTEGDGPTVDIQLVVGDAELTRPGVAHHDHRGGTVVERAGVAGGDGATLTEHRLQAGQSLQGGTGAGPVILGHHRPVRCGHRNDLTVEEARLLGGHRPDL